MLSCFLSVFPISLSTTPHFPPPLSHLYSGHCGTHQPAALVFNTVGGESSNMWDILSRGLKSRRQEKEKDEGRRWWGLKDNEEEEQKMRNWDK